MKKYFISLVLFLLIGLGLYLYYTYIAPQPSDEKISANIGNIKLASWNIRILSSDSRDDASLRKICQSLIDYDFITLIEVRDKPVIQRTEVMLKSMGREYDHQISGEVGDNVKERYAFLYDTVKVKLVTPGRIFPDPGNDFIREPYYATFQAGNFDFTVIAIHIIWGNKVSERRAEITRIADVYKQIQDENPSEQDVILTGDFNREPDDEKAYANLRAIPSMINLFNLPEKTVIFDSNLYDNIWFQSRYVNEYKGIHGIDKFDETDFNNDDKSASIAVSDHRPVWVEFNAKNDDD